MTETQLCPIARLEKVLLVTDGSEFSEGATREAIHFAKICSSKLYVLEVIEINPEFMSFAPQLVEKAEEETRKHLELVKARALKEGVECEIIVHEGEQPYHYIVDEAEKKRANVIIMGTRGRTGLKRLIMGSVTAKVIGHAPCNVIVVPLNAQIKFKNILVATDGSRYSNATASQAIAMAKQSGAHLIAVSVAPSESVAPLDIVQSEMQQELIAEEELKEAEKNVRYVKDLAGKDGLDITGLILVGNPYEAIIDTAKKKDVDLIVIGSHGRSGLERLFMGSVAERVVILSPCAVLVVKIV